MTQVSALLPRLSDLIDLVPCSVGALALEPRRLLIVAQVGPALVEVDLPVAAEGVCEIGGSFYVIGEKTLQPVSLAGALGTAVDVQAQGPIAAATSGMVAVAPGGGLVLFNAAGTILAQRGTPRITAIAASGNTVFAVCGFEVRSFNAADGLREIDRLSVENLLGASRAILSGTDLFVINDARNHKLRFDVSDPAALSLTSDTVGTAAWASETTLSTASPFDPQTTLRRIVVPFTDAPVGVSDHGLVQHTPAYVAITATVAKEPSGGFAPITVAFTTTCTGIPPLQYAWLFGDGGTSTQAAPSHEYATDEDFSGSVTITDAFGRIAIANFTVSLGAVTWEFSITATDVKWWGHINGVFFGLAPAVGSSKQLWVRELSGTFTDLGTIEFPGPVDDLGISDSREWCVATLTESNTYWYRWVDGAWTLDSLKYTGGGTIYRILRVADDGNLHMRLEDAARLIDIQPADSPVVTPVNNIDIRWSDLTHGGVVTFPSPSGLCVAGANGKEAQSDGKLSYVTWSGDLTPGAETGVYERFTHSDGWRPQSYTTSLAYNLPGGCATKLAFPYCNPASWDEIEIDIYTGEPGSWTLSSTIPITWSRVDGRLICRLSEDGATLVVMAENTNGFYVYDVATSILIGEGVLPEVLSASSFGGSLSGGTWDAFQFDGSLAVFPANVDNDMYEGEPIA